MSPNDDATAMPTPGTGFEDAQAAIQTVAVVV